MLIPNVILCVCSLLLLSYYGFTLENIDALLTIPIPGDFFVRK